MLVGLALALLARLGGAGGRARRARRARRHRARSSDVLRGRNRDRPSSRRTTSRAARRSTTAVARLEPWAALVLVPAALAVLAGFSAYAVSAWRMTARQRRAGAQAIIARAGGVHRDGSRGASADAARRRSPATSCRWRLLGLSRRRLALRGLPVHRLDAAARRPCAHVGRDPDRLLARTGRARSSTLGWKVELVWTPGDRAASRRLLLYRAQRRRRRLLEGTPPRPPRRRRRQARLPHPRQRRGRGDRAPARLAAVRARGGRGGRAARSATRTRRA